MSDLEHELKIARAESSKWKQIAEQAQDELAELKKLLVPAGISQSMLTIPDYLLPLLAV